MFQDYHEVWLSETPESMKISPHENSPPNERPGEVRFNL